LIEAGADQTITTKWRLRTIMTFDSVQDVIDSQGRDYERCYVPDVAQAVLDRWDPRPAHYEVVETRS
jgi:hypothetical protein